MKRLISLTSTQDKTPEQVAQELQDSLAKYRQAQDQAQSPSSPPPPQSPPLPE